MRDLFVELIDTLDGIAEDLNPTPEPEPESEPESEPEETREVVTKKTTRRK